jgi:catechol 2,3-dioxygenase-like lactoylglutathione lyase family enzyme
MVRAVGINHVAFEVRDLDEALAWYGRFFDLRMRGRRPTMAWIDLGDQFIALSETAAPARDTHRHVGLVVDDREALRAALRDAGYDVPGSGSLRVHDPSGNQLEIVDYREVQFTKAPAVLRGMEIADIDKTDDARAELAAKGMLDG